MHRAIAAVLLAAAVTTPACAQTPREIMPPNGNFFRAPQGDAFGGREGNRSAIEDALRRRDAQQGGAAPPPPPRAAQPSPGAMASFYGRPWLGYIERALSNAPPPRSSAERDCVTIARTAVQCRLARDSADGAAVDLACIGRNIDNRAWAEAEGRARGSSYLEGFIRVCFAWVDVNQTAPLRR
ncbi:hypothetical protein [Falsiroseomonas sp. E2-1-a4]|uniref:hypothetical protein n=1 Tax=Falsiroseomonas sp. E2-1-a4 TaxID=3239299 RepID=UPI003F37858C